MAGPVGWCSPDNHTCNFVSRPLVKSVCWDQAPARFQRITERGLGSRCFRPCIDHHGSYSGVFRPRRNQSPAHQRQFSDRFFRILANDWDWLSRGNVVARSPFASVWHCVEVFVDKLLPSRQSVSSAHVGDYGRSAIRSCARGPSRLNRSLRSFGRTVVQKGPDTLSLCNPCGSFSRVAFRPP